MTTDGVDYAFTRISETGLAAAGERFAMRYTGPGSDSKHLSIAERDRLWAAGESIVLLAEGAAGDAAGGRVMGVLQARQAEAGRIALGAPALPIYFAVDFDVTVAQWPAVRAYLQGAGSVIGAGRVGIYGGIRAVTWAARDSAAAWFFQTYAWSGKPPVWFAGNHVEQYENNVSLAGGTVDLCRAKRAQFGQWAPPGSPSAPEDDMTPEQEKKLDQARAFAYTAASFAGAAAAGESTCYVMDENTGLINPRDMTAFWTRVAASLTDAQLAAIGKAAADAATAGATAAINGATIHTASPAPAAG